MSRVDKDEVLEWCNRIRAEQGKPPLKSMPRNMPYERRAETCPVARAIGFSVFGRDYKTGPGQYDPLPWYVVNAVRRYDEEVDALLAGVV